MVDQVTFQTIFQFLQTVGILVGVFYYVMTIRANQRNQQMQLETRQAQLFTQFFLGKITPEAMSDYFEVLNWEWEDYGDFEMKYGSDNNPQAAGKRLAWWQYFNMIGKLLREGLINLDLVYMLTTETSLFQWVKWRDVIEEQNFSLSVGKMERRDRGAEGTVLHIGFHGRLGISLHRTDEV
jgi:hypothetical protein